MSLSCKPSARGENACKDRAIGASYTLGTPKTKETWQACMTTCNANNGCKAWTYNPSTKQCAFKKQANFMYQKGSVSGPVEGNVIYPAAVDCSQKSRDEYKYKCDYTIPDKYNLGEASFKTSWSECRSACNADTECKAYTYTAEGMCQKKKLNEYVELPGSKTIAGPQSGPAAGEMTSGTASAPKTTESPTPTPTPTPTSKPENFLMTKSPLGLDWWIVILAIVLIGAASSSMMMMLVMSSRSDE